MTYVIIPTAELTQQMVDDCVETTIDTVRKSVDTTLCVLKYNGDKPASIAAYTDYTHEQILVEMAKPEWSPDLP